MMPYSKTFFAGEGGGGGGVKSKKFLSGHSKKGTKNFFGQKPVKLKVKKFFQTYTSSIIG